MGGQSDHLCTSRMSSYMDPLLFSVFLPVNCIKSVMTDLLYGYESIKSKSDGRARASAQETASVSTHVFRIWKPF
jgi:hypothetical protein